MAALPGIEDLSLTTNGFLLARHARDLAAAGLRRVNVSLDTLRADRFAAIARRGSLEEVLAGLDAALDAGLTPIKLNMVVMRGVNDDEVVDFARLSVVSPFHVRYIELMPINWSGGAEEMTPFYSLAGPAIGNVTLFAHEEAATFRRLFHPTTQCQTGGMLSGAQMRRMFVSAGETRRHIEESLGPLEPAEVPTNGPARSYRAPGAIGTVGFISQVTNDHCAACNRLRLTADGFLRPCLMADGEVDLRTPLRSGASDEEIAGLFLLTVHHKPKEHRLEDGVAPTGRGMSQLGG